ncbi:MAG: glycosyltransferase, partial [Methylocella sp.]
TIVSILLIAWITIAILSTLSAWRYTWGLPLSEIPGSTPPVAVIVAVKNASEVSRAFFCRLRHQAYPDYRIIAAVESEEDPAFAMATEESRHPGAPLRTVVAGQSGRSGQKVWNLLAALDAIEDRDEIVAFVDADTLPAPEWLSRLVAALVNTGRDAVTGYRWIVPADNRVSSAVVAAANASVVTAPRLPSIINHCWGGTMAMRRKTLERIDIRRYWAGAISDDAQMTRAFKEAGYGVFSPRQSLLLSPVAMSWSEALSFGRRQYRILLLHDSGIWALAALGTLVPAAAAIAALSMALQGSVLAIVLIGVSLALGEVRYRCRRKIVIALWGEATAAGHPMYWRVERWLRPVWWSFHALCVFSAPGSR